MKYEIFAGIDDVYRDSFKYGAKTGYISASTVLKFVCERNNVSIDTLKSSTRKREVVQVRQQYIWLYRALLVKKGISVKMKLPAGNAFGSKVSNNNEVMRLIGKSHCLADHSWEAYENLFITNKALETKSIEYLEELDKLIV
jgi:site-specific recombinase XerD